MAKQFRADGAGAGHGELLEAAFASTSQALVVLDASCLVLRINHAAEALTGWSETHACGRRWSEVVRLSRGPDNTTDDAQSGFPRFGEYRATLADRGGSLRQVHVRAERIRITDDGAVAGAMLSLREPDTPHEPEDASSESRHLLQIAVDSGQVGVWDWDCVSDCVHEYGTWVGKTAHTAAGATLSGETLLRNTHPDDVQAVREALLEHLTGARDYHEIEQRVRLVDGGYARFLVRGRTVERDETGRAVRVMGTYTDMALSSAQERRLQIALENGRQGLWEWEPEARRVSFSPEWYALFGYPPDSIVADKDDILRLLHPDDIARTKSAVLTFLKGAADEIQIEQRFRHREGHYIDILSRGRVVDRDARGRVTRVMGTHVDVTAIKHTEAQLLQSRRFLETVIDAFPQRVFWKEANGRYLGSNQLFAQDAGLASSAEIVGKLDEEMPWSEIADVLGADDERILSGAESRLVVERPRQVDGKRAWFETTKVPLRGPVGEVIGVLGLTDDVTVRRERERQLRVVADALTSGRQDRLLNALTRAAAELAGASSAFVSRVNGDGTATITACYPAAPPLKDLCYEISGTPCSDALRIRRCFVPHDIQSAYPDDELLRTWHIEGYAGSALNASDGEPIGLFVLMFDQQAPDQARVEAVIDIFAARAAAELERERTHAELLASEARLNAAIEGGSQGVWEWDPDSDCLRTIGHLFRDMGYAQGEEPTTGADLARRVHPDDRPKLTRALRRYFRGEKSDYEVELRLRHADGHYLWTLARGRAVDRYPDGRVRTMIGTHTDISALKESQSALRRSQQLLEAALEGGEQGVWEWDPGTDELLSFGGYSRTLGIDIENAVISGAALLERLHPEDHAVMRDALHAYFRGRRPVYEFEGRMRDTDGVYRWMLLRGKATLRDSGGRIIRMLGTFTDISSIKTAQAGLERSQQFMQLIINTVPQSIFWQDREGRYTGCNQQFAELAGLSAPEELVGLTDRELWWSSQADVYGREDAELLNSGASSLNLELSMTDLRGRAYWFDLVKVPIRDDSGNVIGMLGAFQDISERKKAEEEAQRLALYDPLTDLPNRRYFTERLESSLASANRRGTTGALLFIDLDEFKQINDTLGHPVGDALLRAVAERLEHVTRQEDVVARLGGDEFVVLLPELAEEFEHCATQAQFVADKIRESLGRSFQFEHHRFHITPTIGISLFPDAGKTADDVLKEADTAMYSGKSAGRNATRFFRREMEESAQQRLRLETDLRQALPREEFEIYYQPQVDRDGQIIGAEALLRWHHPERGLVPPGEFIPVAEERGLIVEIGRWIFDDAFATFKSWLDSSLLDVGELAINVSSRQLRDENFVRDVEAVLVKHRIPPHRIVFELTESTVIEDVEATIGIMTRLRRLGICFALDDFGVGYSSLSYLKRLPIDHLKIDRSFIADIGRDRNDEVICHTIVAMAQHLGLRTIAEGVETAEQFEFLKKLRCDGYQGYLFTPPTPAQAFVGQCRLGALAREI